MRYWLLVLRRKMGLTQHELAEKVGVSRQTISQIENGYGLRKNTAKRIAEVMSFDWTKFYEDEARTSNP